MPALGTLAAVRQGRKFGWDLARGPYSVETWRGGEDAIRAKASELANIGWSYDCVEGPGDPPIWTLEARSSDTTGGGGGGGVEVTETWEVAPNKVAKPLLQADCTLIKGLSEKQIGYIQKYINNPELVKDGIIWTGTAPEQAASAKVYAMLRCGVEHYNVFQPVLRHTWVVPTNANPAFAFTNSGKLLTTAQLYSVENLPSNFLLPLAEIATLFGTVTRTDGVALAWRWYKNMPTLRMSTNGRKEVVGEWEFGLWSTDIYSVVS
jgi:hypothetical protein